MFGRDSSTVEIKASHLYKDLSIVLISEVIFFSKSIPEHLSNLANIQNIHTSKQWRKYNLLPTLWTEVIVHVKI